MGQDTSLPRLPMEQTSIMIKNTNEEGLRYRIKPMQAVTEISMMNAPVKFFPKKLLNLVNLTLINNNLNEVEEIIAETKYQFPDLEFLAVTFNKLTISPEIINRFKKLKSVSLNRNKISETWIVKLPNLEHLSCSNNLMTLCPIDLPHSLRVLNLRFNKIKFFELSLPNLEVLDLSGNEIVELSFNCEFPRLTEFNISYNEIVVFDNVAKIAPSLKILDISFNMMSAFPTNLPKTIESVSASFNHLVEWRESLEQYMSLKSLNVSHNRLSMLPKLPPNLTTCDVTHNMLSHVDEIENRTIETLDFSRSEFTALPNIRRSQVTSLILTRNIIERLNIECLSNSIQSIDISRNRLLEIDPAIFKLSRLRKLSVCYNELTTIPREIGSSGLKELYIGENPISSLPPLPRGLSILSACHCHFTEVPDGLRRCSQLVSVDLSGNRLKTVSFLPNAQKLNFAINRITEIPSVPKAVTDIDFSNNSLTAFDLLPQFVSVDVSHNNIVHLRMNSATGFPAIRTLKLSHNANLCVALELEMFPGIQRLDLCGTSVGHAFPLPDSIKIHELITTSKEICDLVKTGRFKHFSVDCGYSEDIGMRDHMEDALIIASDLYPGYSLYGVLDGHGGTKSSLIAASLIPRTLRRQKPSPEQLEKALYNTNVALQKRDVPDGCTVAMALIYENQIVTCHMGDTRVILVKKTGEVVQLTDDHKSTVRREIELLKENGSFLKDNRVDGFLAVSRSLADFGLPGLIRVPETRTYEMTKDDFRLIIACDGVCDVLENAEIAQIAGKELDVHRAACLIKNMAIAMGSTDNVSVIVLDLNAFH